MKSIYKCIIVVLFAVLAGAEYTLGTAKIEILGPNREYDNPNDSSIALRLENGENSFLFTGDT